MRAAVKVLFQMALQRRKRFKKRMPKQQHPDAIRMAYFGALRGILQHAHSFVQRLLLPMLPRLLSDAATERGDELRLDAGAKRIRAVMQEITSRYTQTVSDDALETTAERIGQQTSRFQKEQLSRQMEATTGITLGQVADLNVRPLLEDFTTQNVALIKSIPEDYFADIEQQVLTSVRNGTRAEDLADTLEERYGVAESRAQLIARDQVGKFYGELSKARQTNLGVTSYTWRTSEDSRVRPEHEDRDGKTFDWDNPPEDGNPGQPIQCRCFADPDVESILDSL